MPTTINVDLTEDDAETPTFAIKDNASAALDLTTADVFAVIKASQHVEDNASSGVYTLTEGSGVTIVSAAAGTVKLAIPSAVNASPGTWYYKIRVTVSGATRTAIVGWLYIVDT